MGMPSAADSGEITILALGDSTTAGTPGFRSPIESPPNGSGDQRSQYAYWVAKQNPHWHILNRGVNGERSDQILRRLQPDLKKFHPQIVIVLAGVNDLYQGYSPEWVEKNLEGIYSQVVKEKAKVIACTILPYNQSTASVQARMREVNEWIRGYSAKAGFGFCDLFHVVEDPSRPGKLISTADGLHPDVEGYRKMGEALADGLEHPL